MPNVYPDDILARLRRLEKLLGLTASDDPSVMAGAPTSATNYWKYLDRTLSPDPTTTSPLDTFRAVATDTNGTFAVTASSVSELTKLTAVNRPNAVSSDGSFLAVESGDEFGEIEIRPGQIDVLTHVEGVGTEAHLELDDTGSFSLTADDGTTQTEVSTTGGTFNGSIVSSGTAEADFFAQSNNNNGTIQLVGQDGVIGTVLFVAQSASFSPGMRLQAADGLGPLVAFTSLNAEPDDSQLGTSEWAFWLDDTIGASVLNVKAKDSGGTVVTGSIPLA